MYVSTQHFAERDYIPYFIRETLVSISAGNIDNLSEVFHGLLSPVGKYQESELYLSLHHAHFLSHFNNRCKSRHYQFRTSESAVLQIRNNKCTVVQNTTLSGASIAPPAECRMAAIFVWVLLAHCPNCITIMPSVTQTCSNIKSINSRGEDTTKWWACGDLCDILLFPCFQVRPLHEEAARCDAQNLSFERDIFTTTAF